MNTIDEAKAAANKAAREERKQANLRGIMERFRAVQTQDAQALACEVHADIEAWAATARAGSMRRGRTRAASCWSRRIPGCATPA